MYHKFSGSQLIFLLLYVDDVLLANNDIGLIARNPEIFIKKFEVKDLGDAYFILGIQISKITLEVYLGYH